MRPFFLIREGLFLFGRSTALSFYFLLILMKFRTSGCEQGLSGCPCILRSALCILFSFASLGFAPVGAAKELSARPLGTFGSPVYTAVCARGESHSEYRIVVRCYRANFTGTDTGKLRGSATDKPVHLSCDLSRAPPACAQATGENCCQC